MTSSEVNNGYKDKIDERPIRVDHGLIGKEKSEGSSADGVSHEKILEFLRGSESVPMHPFSVLLNFTMEMGNAVSHPAFGEEVVRDLCTKVLGK